MYLKKISLNICVHKNAGLLYSTFYATHHIFKMNTQNYLFETFLKKTILYVMTNYTGKTPGC